MRLGILIVGSLYWDRSPVRCRWRQDRLGCTGERRVRVPIRYGKKSEKRGNTYTMVFAMSCAEKDKLGTGLVVPARAECCEPGHLVEEAECLWAAERDKEEPSGICGKWGKVCILANPDSSIATPVLDAWRGTVEAAGDVYCRLPTATDEKPVLDATTGHALFGWPTDDETQQPLAAFDLLLMMATKADLANSQYTSTEEIARAWKADPRCNVNYFFNNRHYGMTTFEDNQIMTALWGGA